MTRCMYVSICLNVLSNQSGIFDISFNFLALFSLIVFGHAGVSGHVRNEWARPQALNKQEQYYRYITSRHMSVCILKKLLGFVGTR